MTEFVRAREQAPGTRRFSDETRDWLGRRHYMIGTFRPETTAQMIDRGLRVQSARVVEYPTDQPGYVSPFHTPARDTEYAIQLSEDNFAVWPTVDRADKVFEDAEEYGYDMRRLSRMKVDWDVPLIPELIQIAHEHGGRMLDLYHAAYFIFTSGRPYLQARHNNPPVTRIAGISFDLSDDIVTLESLKVGKQPNIWGMAVALPAAT